MNRMMIMGTNVDERRYGLEKDALTPMRPGSVSTLEDACWTRVNRQRILPTKHGHVGTAAGNWCNPRISE